MNTILEFFKDVVAMLPTMGLMDFVDILVAALLLYGAFQMIRTTGAARIAKGIVLILLLYFLTQVFNMYLMNYLLEAVLEIGVLAVIIMFQPELRRLLEKLGGRTMKELLNINLKEEERDIERVISQTVQACETLSRERTGVLIVMERKDPLSEYQKNGTEIDARVSSELLRNLFFTKAALHDGAVLIRNERVAAAGCVLPLTQNRNISSDLGTRHRAAIGISEVTDAVVVVVSEETGTISVAMDGMLKRHLAPQTLKKLLRKELASETDEAARGGLKQFWKKWKVKDDTDAEA